MFGLKLFSSSLHYSTQASANARLVVNYIRECIHENGICKAGSWVYPSSYFMKVGIGEYGNKKAIQTINYHLEVENEDTAEIKCYDKIRRTALGNYKLITDSAHEAQVISSFAEMVQDIKNNKSPKTSPGTPFF